MIGLRVRFIKTHDRSMIGDFMGEILGDVFTVWTTQQRTWGEEIRGKRHFADLLSAFRYSQILLEDLIEFSKECDDPDRVVIEDCDGERVGYWQNNVGEGVIDYHQEFTKIMKILSKKEKNPILNVYRIIKETENEIVLDKGDGYRIRATVKIVGAFVIVAIDWEHPNYGYFLDVMLWYKAMHMLDWGIVPIADWSKEYLEEENGKSRSLLKEFLEDYPEFKKFFDLGEHT